MDKEENKRRRAAIRGTLTGAKFISSISSPEVVFQEPDETMCDSQRKQILEYMDNYGSITSFEAMQYLHIMSPRKRLSEINSKTPLKKTEHKDTWIINGKRKTKRYIEYSLPDED